MFVRGCLICRKSSTIVPVNWRMYGDRHALFQKDKISNKTSSYYIIKQSDRIRPCYCYISESIISPMGQKHKDRLARWRAPFLIHQAKQYTPAPSPWQHHTENAILVHLSNFTKNTSGSLHSALPHSMYVSLKE